MYTDEGKEYLNSSFQQVLKKFRIEHRVPKNHDIKCGIAENAVKRLKTRIYRYFSSANTKRWVDVLDDIVHALNHVSMKSLGGISPADVTPKNAEVVWQNMYGHEKFLKSVHKFPIGQKVRLSVGRIVFRKGYKFTYTPEVFLIKKHLFKDPPAYIIEDQNGKELDSVVYESKLVAYNKLDPVLKVAKVVKTRKRNRALEYLVRWEGFASKFDSWIDKEQLDAYTKS